MPIRHIIEALDHLMEARRHLRKAWRIMRDEVPEIAAAIEPAGGQISGILGAIKTSIDAERVRRSGTVPEQNQVEQRVDGRKHE